MLETQASSASRFPKIQFVLFSMLLLTLVWRIMDFFDEVISGTTKMNLGDWGLEGYDALIAQLAIIGILLLLVIRVRKPLASLDAG
ncbi:MAG: hypothetical protein V7742_10985 [Halioglobus sp.]